VIEQHELDAIPGPQEAASEQVRRYIESPIEFWEACAREFGPVVRLDFGSLGPVVLFSDPVFVRDIFRLPPQAFECSPYNEHYRYVMGDLSLLLQDGPAHRRQRRLVAPIFRHDALVPKLGAIRKIVASTVDQWPAGRPFNPRPWLHEITAQVILDLIFADPASPGRAAIFRAYRASVARQVGSWGPWRNFARMQPKIREVLAQEIEARRQNPDMPGFLTLLSLARDESGALLSNEECEDHVFTFLVAGVDTSAISLAWAMHWLAREPVVREKLAAELAVSAEDESGEVLLGLPYLEAVFLETLRMYPIVPTPSGRKLLQEAVIGGVRFGPGTTLVPCTYLVHRREDLYPESSRFLPERHLTHRFEPFEYFPFGGGARTCVGEMLARMEFKVAIQTILDHWEIENSLAPPLSPVRHGTLLAPPDNSTVVVHPASKTHG
jgi:cytochrome P450 family 110